LKSRLVLIVAVYLVVILSIYVGAESNDVMTFEADISAPVVSISVPDSVAFGEVYVGYDSEQISFLINNTGTTDVRITAEMVNYSEKIFRKYLYLWGSGISQKRVENFTMNISRPSSPEGIESKTVYAKLKLSEVEEEIEEDMVGYKSNVVFWAMPK